MHSSSATTVVLLVGSLLTGLGFCALLPPLEGFDETAHYSSIAQIAQTGTWPRLNDPMSAEVDGYMNLAPTPAGGRWTYWSFFQAPAATRDAGAKAIHDARDPGRTWRPGAVSNWEGQHPPLYYAVLAPVWLLSKSWSIYAQIVLLRGVSYLFAWAGLVIAAIALARSATTKPVNGLLMLGPALWPALFPMWFPEMARLGNDSLILLLVALAFVAMRRAFGPRGQTRDFALLGVLCGLALLTKATALPLVGALALFLAGRVWRAAGTIDFRPAVVHLAAFGLAAVAIVGWWYAKSLIDYGSVIVSADNVALSKQGGLLEGLRKNFSLPSFVIGLLKSIRSFTWTGTWSYVFLPRLVEIPLIALVGVIGGGAILHLTKHRTSDIEAIALLTFGLFVIALVAHTLVFIALLGAYSPGAWYVHSLAPLMAVFVIFALVEATRWRRLRHVFGALLIYPIVFLPFVTAFHLFYFAGCLPDAAVERRPGLMAIAACARMPREIASHLAVLGDPAVAIPLFATGCAIMLVGVLLFVRRNFFAGGDPNAVA